MGKSAWLIVLVFGALQTTWSQDVLDRALKSKIIALERVAKIQAFESKDLKTLEAVLDDRFLSVDASGKLQTKADLIAFVQATDWLQYQLSDMDVRIHKDTIVVTGLYQIKGVARVKGLLQSGRFVDTWRLKDGAWILIASLSTPAP